MPGDRKSVQDAAPARDPNLTFSFGEAFEKLVAENNESPRLPDEFTVDEFAIRTNLDPNTAYDRLNKLVKEGKVERRKYRKYLLYRVKE